MIQETQRDAKYIRTLPARGLLSDSFQISRSKSKHLRLTTLSEAHALTELLVSTTYYASLKQNRHCLWSQVCYLFLSAAY